MNGQLAGAIILVLLASLPLLSSVTIIAAGEEIKGLTFKSTLSDNILTVENDFYVFKLNLTRGAGVFEWSIKVEGSPLDMVRSEPYPLSLLIHALSGGKSPSEFTIKSEDKLYKLDYPGSLGYYSWNAEVITNESGVLVVELKPSLDAMTDIEPLDVSVRIAFTQWSPVVEYDIVFTNQGDSPVELTGVNGTVDVLLVVDDGVPGVWWFAVGSRDGYTYNVDLYNETMSVPGGDVDSIIIYRKSRDERPTFASFINPVDGTPSLVEGVKGFNSGNYTKPTSVLVKMRYPSSMLNPGETYEIKFRVGYIEFAPLQASIADLTPYMLKIDPEMGKDLKLGVGYVREIKRMNSTIQSLRDRVKNLQEKVEEQEKKIEESKGCEDYWKTELTVVKKRLESLREKAQRAALIQVASFIIGVILGLIGGIYAWRR
ncbi:MAG: hypothetical protein F7C81_06340 [Desulfurococcales archaeon]|nr:hypothetical protein [Desulfurococcales archaeon]